MIVYSNPGIDFMLRAGVRNNQAESGEGMLYTVGFCTKISRFSMNFSGTFSDKSTTDEKGDSIPVFYQRL